MIDRFETLTTATASIYKSIQSIRDLRMDSIGLRGSDVMCLYHLHLNSAGLTAAELCDLCQTDKAHISRVLSRLESNGMIRYEDCGSKRRYRARAILTDSGDRKAHQLFTFVNEAVNAAGNGISDHEREIFYRVLALIDENLKMQAAHLKATVTAAAKE